MLKLLSAAKAGLGITHSDHPRVIEMHRLGSRATVSE
jgi:hypothetical protein